MIRLRTIALPFVLLGSGLLSSAVKADWRVLVAFDAAGTHRIVRATQVPDGERVREREVEPLDPARRAEPVPTGHLRVIWLDASGQIHGGELLPDPRLTHAPVAASSQSRPEPALLQDGAYLLTVPDDATEVVLGFAANHWLSLPALEVAFPLGPSKD